jgi:hypothetical protein
MGGRGCLARCWAAFIGAAIYLVLVGPPVTRPVPQWLGRHPSRTQNEAIIMVRGKLWPSPYW